MKLINPSVRLRAAVTIVDSGYTHTCRNSNCCHASHDPGYDWIEAEIPAGVEIYTSPGSPSSHAETYLYEEYVEFRTTKALPPNTPEWGKTLNTRESGCGYKYGEGVEVSQDGGFTIVQLLVGRGTSWVQKELFATKDGVGDHTKEYKQFRFDRKFNAEIARLTGAGLTQEEARRLFKTARQQWAGEQEHLLVRLAPTLRLTKQGLIRLGWANSRRVQQQIIARCALEIPQMSHPRTQSFAARALWVFHKAKPTAEDYSKVSDEQSLMHNPSVEDVSPPRPGLVSLGSLFPAVA